MFPRFLRSNRVAIDSRPQIARLERNRDFVIAFQTNTGLEAKELMVSRMPESKLNMPEAMYVKPAIWLEDWFQALRATDNE